MASEAVTDDVELARKFLQRSQGFDIIIHEDSATTAHLVLPPSPELTEDELEKVAGGVFIWGYV